MNQMQAEVTSLSSKIVGVKTVFEDVSRYVGSRWVDIQVRADTVRAFAEETTWSRLLDVGCGDGSISLPLLSSQSHLTLLDLSANMLARVESRIPRTLAANVELHNGDFMCASFDPASFDLIVSVGVLAHVDSPDQFVAKLKSLLRPGGRLILEFTDSRHFVGRLSRAMGALKEIFAPAKYPTNRLCIEDLKQIFGNHSLELVSSFRYSTIPIPLLERLVSPEILLSIVRFIFGRSGKNRNSWLGNEYICLLSSE
jgi:2-polyprenyl-3-methyl-5-hydroxy-6-metoxy-1,4-benzoquinol methylase